VPDFVLFHPEFDAAAGLVDLGDGLAFPERVVVPVVWGHRRLRFHLRVRWGEDFSEGPEIVVVEVAIRDMEDGIFSRSLREVPFDDMRAAVIERATFRNTSSGLSDSDATESLASMTRRRRPKQTRSDLALARVAEVYVNALDKGLSCTDAVQRHLGGSTSTAVQWVWTARTRGFLTKTDPGQAGGQLTAKARRILDENPKENRP